MGVATTFFFHWYLVQQLQSHYRNLNIKGEVEITDLPRIPWLFAIRHTLVKSISNSEIIIEIIILEIDMQQRQRLRIKYYIPLRQCVQSVRALVSNKGYHEKCQYVQIKHRQVTDHSSSSSSIMFVQKSSFSSSDGGSGGGGGLPLPSDPPSEYRPKGVSRSSPSSI